MMPIEVEMKFAIRDETDFLKALTQWDVQLGDREHQVDLYFAHPQRDFRHTDEALRIRRTERRVDVAYKGPRLDARTKTRREIELPLAGGERSATQFTEILEALGFRPAGEVRKFRRAATLNVRGKTVTIALDRVDELGIFVELEIVADPGEVAVARDALEFLATELALGATERRSYLELLAVRSVPDSPGT